MRRLSFCLMLMFSLGLLVGCGGVSDAPVTYPVSGTVTFDGEPLAEGSIIFRDVDGKATTAAGKIENGEFSFDSVGGKKDVVITASREVPGKMVEGGAPGEPAVPAIEQYLPEIYNTKTTLKADVTDSGANEFTFELKSK